MPRILVVDDEQAIALILSEALNDEGHDVATAFDGYAALEQLRRRPPDVVLLDLRMPGMSGRLVLETMRANAVIRNTPVILITGAVPNAKDFPPEGTYQAVIFKPFDVKVVTKLVNDLLEEAKPTDNN
ncbi:MAG: response regulator [Bacteroidota bacterium]